MLIIKTSWSNRHYDAAYHTIGAAMSHVTVKWDLNIPHQIPGRLRYTRDLIILGDLTEQQKFLLLLKLTGHWETD